MSGFTQEALAKRLGVTFQAVSKWENGKSSPDVLLLPVMAEALGCSIDELFSFTPKSKLQDENNDYVIKQIKSQINDSESAEKFLSIIAMDGGKEKSVSRQMTPTILATGLEYGKHTITIKPYFTDSTKDNSKFLIKAFFVRDERTRTVKYEHKHRFDNYVSDKNATCIKDGTKIARCYRQDCDMTDTVVVEGSRLKHNFEVVATKKATFTKNGKGEKICTLCGRFDDFATIRKIKSVVASDCHYNGKAQTPKITVKDSAGKIVSSKYYTVKYYGKRKALGSYKVKVTFKGNYKGSKTVKFKINPPKSSVKKLTAAKKSLKVKITKQTKQVKGYEIEYSTNKKFTKSTTKTQIVKSNKKTSLTLKGLNAKKKYYVRVRTYKSVGKIKYYSAWSKTANKKIK